MFRRAGDPSSTSGTANEANNGRHDIGALGGKEKAKYSQKRKLQTTQSLLLTTTAFVFGMVVGANVMLRSAGIIPEGAPNEVHSAGNGKAGVHTPFQNLVGIPSSGGASEDAALDALMSRALLHQGHCSVLGLDDDSDHSLLRVNNHTAHLPQFGILNAIREYRQSKNGNSKQNEYPYQCTLPPEYECDETSFTVVFMAYNPDRLKKMFAQIRTMLTDPDYARIVAEVIVVWNGERHVDETPLGKAMVEFGRQHPLRISYPLKAGFPNDLMNRYHPRLEVKTRAVMYYDDDGPFYSYPATLGGFELWKRNANAQVGAMARKLDLGPRQLDESRATLNGPGDRFFISQCPKDELVYNYREFATFGARMVLPSGSFLHSNYLCFLWHPVFEEIRQYVKRHPVNPDDGTVSTIVSQLAGRAPKTYSRRITGGEQPPLPQEKGRRRLMDGIDWDTAGGHDKKMNWGKLRSDAANSLARYFGSVNSGSIGWCYGTKFQDGESCKPEMAGFGQLPWMNEDHTPRVTCP